MPVQYYDAEVIHFRAALCDAAKMQQFSLSSEDGATSIYSLLLHGEACGTEGLVFDDLYDEEHKTFSEFEFGEGGSVLAE